VVAADGDAAPEASAGAMDDKLAQLKGARRVSSRATTAPSTITAQCSASV
jgi:hypothetical protein